MNHFLTKSAATLTQVCETEGDGETERRRRKQERTPNKEEEEEEVKEEFLLLCCPFSFPSSSSSSVSPPSCCRLGALCAHHAAMHHVTSLHAKIKPLMQSYIAKMRACLGVTCHLQFWQNHRDLPRAAAVTLGKNGYRNTS